MANPQRFDLLNHAARQLGLDPATLRDALANHEAVLRRNACANVLDDNDPDSEFDAAGWTLYREAERVEGLLEGRLMAPWKVGDLIPAGNLSMRVEWVEGVHAVVSYGADFFPFTVTDYDNEDGEPSYCNAAEARGLDDAEFDTLEAALAVFALPES